MNGRLLPLRLVALPAQGRRRSTASASGFLGVKPSSSTPASRRRSTSSTSTCAVGDAPDVGRDGLDPRDQHEHEPGDGGDGRTGRQALPRLRARTGENPTIRPASEGIALAMRRSEYLKASPPMFESGLLDRFTRVHPAVPVLIYLPVIAAALPHRHRARSASSPPLGLALGGYAVWTLTEYWLHRVVFHFEPERGLGARLHWMIHGVHHDHPNDPMRLVMPPSASVPLALLFYGLVLARAGRRRRDGVHRRLPGGLSRLRHGPLRGAPPRAAHGGRPQAARAAHAPPLPGRRARLRRQRAVLGPRVRHRAAPAGPRVAHASGIPVMLSRS